MTPAGARRTGPDRATRMARTTFALAVGVGAVATLTLVTELVAGLDGSLTPRGVVEIPTDMAAPPGPSPTPFPTMAPPSRPPPLTHVTVGCARAPDDPTPACPRWTLQSEVPLGAPTVAGDQVFIGAGDQVIALRAIPGRIIWHEVVGAPVTQPPAVDDDHVYVMDDTGTLTAFDRGTGARRWQLETGRPNISPVVAGDVVVVGVTGGIIGLDRSDGSRLWKVAVSGQPGQPGAAGGLVYVADGNQDLRAVDAASGRVVWQERESWWWVAAHDHQPTLLVAPPGGPVVGHNRFTGERLWTTDREGVWTGATSIAGGPGFLVSSTDGEVIAVDASTGRASPLGTTLAVPDTQGLVFLLGSDGAAAALTPDGTPVWSGQLPLEVGDVAFGWFHGAPWMIAVDTERTHLAGIPTVRRPPPAPVGSLDPDQPCPTTPLQDRPYGTVAVGAHTELRGLGISPPHQSQSTFVLIFPQPLALPVTLRGHRLDGPGSMSFRAGADEPATAELVLNGAGVRGRTAPGWPMHWAVLAGVPEPGCWSYDLDLGAGRTDQVIVDITAEQLESLPREDS